MEKAGKGKGKPERDLMSWLGSGSDRSTELASHPLGTEAAENSRGASRFRARSHIPSDASTHCCHQLGPVHKRGPVMASSPFTAVDKILGYEIASLNRSLQQRPNGAVCQATPAAKT
ncbi:Gamma-Aminobutyric Acid Receptor Subunit Rho-1 [Manis pentadactyla]|nr:Gamma-Aminobutyric Acid Receptor Subunit Rho-1 [Manis pentadactyla]